MGPLSITSPYGLLSGRVTALVADPRNADRVYLAAAGGGVWRSTDSGSTWQSVGDNMLSMASGTLVIDERVGAQGALYYGTGDATGNTYGAGILRSTDGGATWQQMSAQFDFGVTWRIALHPRDPQILMAARNSGVWRTTDSGATWLRTLTGQATDVAIADHDPNLALAALGARSGAGENGVYRSTDGGASWTLVESMPFGVTAGRVSLAKAKSSPATVYALIARAGDFSLQGLYRSDDFGISWRRLGTVPPGLFFNGRFHQGNYSQLIAVDPRNENRVYAGGYELYRTDNGVEWTALSVNSNNQRLVHEGMFALAFRPDNPDAIYLGSEGGVYRSGDRGANWINANHALPITQFNNIAVNAGATVILGGSQSNGAMVSGGEFVGWSQALPGEAGSVAFDSSNPSVIYANLPFVQPFRSDDGGRTWQSIGAGLPQGDAVSYYAPLISDLAVAQGLLFGTHRVWRSTNGGASWAAISGPLHEDGHYITALAATPAAPGMYMAATSGGRLAVTRDGGATWRFGEGIPNRYLTAVTIDSRNPQRAFLTAWGFGTGHIFRTLDGGVTWQDVSANLPDAPANAVVIDPRGPVYVGADVGVFRSELGDGSWTSFNQGLPNTIVTALSLDPVSNTLVAGTYGRGAFYISLRAPGATPAPPAILGGGVVNAASYSRVLAPGAMASIFGANLARETVTNTQLPVATRLEDTTVTVNGVPAPLYFVSPGQINFQVPYEVVTAGATLVVSTANGSSSVQVQIAPASPGIFPGSVNRANGRVSSENPAAAGEVLTLFATGLGTTNPALATGAAGPSSPPAQTAQAVSAYFGEAPAAVLFAGVAPGFVGLYQVNVLVPAVAGPSTTLTLVAGGRSSNVVTIPVR